MIKKPLLASNAELDKIKYPVLASPKLDGIRCLIIDGQVLSRNFKPIPNLFVQKNLQEVFSSVGKGRVIDGELILKGKAFNEISSAIMSEDGEPDFTYMVFDTISATTFEFFSSRIAMTKTLVNVINTRAVPFEGFSIEVVSHIQVNNKEELDVYVQDFLTQGYEGTMLRDPNGKYKEGRSTAKEGILLKVKEWEDAEAIVIGFEEQMKNNNEKKLDEVGRNKRSSHQANKTGKDTLGALIVKNVSNGVEFNVASGMNDALRQEVWDNKDKYMGKLVKYKFQPHGVVEKPRIPTFIGFRHENDL